MTALAANLEVDRKDGKIVSHKVKGSTHIYKGALVKTAGGYLAPEAAGASEYFAGVAYEEVNNTGADGAVECRVEKEGVFLLTGSGFAQTDVGKPVYASDDQTISTTQGTNQHEVGTIVEFESATKVWVKINSAVA